MFVYNIDNRKMDDEPGAGGGAGGSDSINISGFTDDNPPTPPKQNDPPKPNDPPKDPPKPTDPPTGDLVEFGESTDSILKDFVSSKYDDLSLVRLNKDGALVNTEGKVLISKEDLDKETNTIKEGLVTKATEYISGLDEVEIDGKSYKIEEDGSVKNEEGEVILTKEALIDQIMQGDDYLAEPDPDDVSIYAQAQQLTGLELVDDNGNPVEFEETPEGLAQRDLHIARQEGNRIANETINSFFSEYPQLEDAFYYLKTRGNLEGFGSQTNHEGVTIDKNNEQQQVDIVMEREMRNGYTREQAAKRVDLYKQNDMLYEESTSALSFIQKAEQDDKAATRAQFEASEQAKAQEQAEYWNNVAAKLQTGKVLDYTIPENIRVPLENGTVKYFTKQDFYNYMRVPVKGNLTQAQLDAQSEPVDVKIFNDYLRFVGHNMSYIIEQRVNAKQVNDLRQRFNRDAIPAKKVVITPTAKKSNNDKIVM